ncbi:E3 UFM1-protein ligase 1 homolog [Stomoxys calcitrans]|uniref:E3 UFM1-protein ligase 1 homolog n=1 Tax=Stomoxys calcitrans TaxID=35570 RepID=UPI0027E217C8|nr:E3 UFM1-protein ligase 1 homolog [Stomoxys calcitrans]
MTSDWDEVKRLAADFQKAQLTSTLQKLSEHNCVEIVTLLLEKKLLEVIFTNDGKEYITPDHLEKEVQDELYVNGGRVNLVEVSKNLNVDLTRIEDVAKKIAAETPSIHFILGQLIDEDYITYIAQEINEKLSQRGEISVNDLTEQFDLPSDFLQKDVLEKHLGKIIKGRQDPSNPRVFFTQAYLQRCKAKIRGALAAITRPTNVSVILQQTNIQQKIFHTLVDEISPAGQVTSKLANAQYIPHIYAKMQSDWVNNFYRQNGFLEYDAIQKLGITNAKQFINKQFPDEELMYLKRCAVSSKLIELTVLPALSAAKQFIDLSSLLPSNMSSSDREELFEAIMSQHSSVLANFVLIGSNSGSSVVFTPQYLEELTQPCRELACAKAKSSVDSGSYQQYIATKQISSKSGQRRGDDDDDDKLDKRDERRKKAASGKAGGGAQGRETKTKSTKKHPRGGKKGGKNEFDSDDEDMGTTANSSSSKKQYELITIADLVKVLDKETSALGIDELNEDIAGMYHEQLNQLALAKAQELYEITLQKSAAGSGQSHAAVQEKINTLLVDLRLYEKGLKLFPANAQQDLMKYLLKSLGNDISNELILYVANECQIEVKNPNLNVDQRNKLAQECGGDYKPVLLELNKALNKTIDEFVLATENALKICSMIVKKVDKKKDRQLIIQHREKLLEQLQQCSEPALILHLTTLVLFTTITGYILHASGKFVSQILAFINSSMTDEHNKLLTKYHDLVISVLRLANDSAEYTTATAELTDLEPKIKQLASSFEKPGVSKSE